MLLQEKHIALWNVLSHCEREGSADHTICNEQPNDFDDLHEKYPEIRIFFLKANHLQHILESIAALKRV